MERISTVTFVPSEKEKDELNELIRKLSVIKSELGIAKCEDAKQKLDDAKATLVTIRDGKPIRIEE